MALGALIAAYALADAGDGLRATLPLAGRTLLEHQARLAARAGANHIVILVERLPAALTAAIDRLRRDGLDMDIARSVADAADRFHPDERLLFVADGFVGSKELFDGMAEAEPPALLTVPDGPEAAEFERIDALSRWAGIAIVDGGALRRTAAMLGDWDLQSTLLRRTVQGGAKRIDARDLGRPHIVTGPAALEGIARELIDASRPGAEGWPSRFLFPIVERPLLDPLIRSAIEPPLLSIAAIVLMGVGAIAFAMGWLWLGYGLLLLAGPIESIGRRLGRIRLSTARLDPPLERGRAIAATCALICLSGSLATYGNWGCWPLAAATIAFMAATGGAQRLLRGMGGSDASLSLGLARIDSLIWAHLPFAAAGYWRLGLAALAVYAGASFFAVQRRAILVLQSE
ncbi:hypothetical protein [Flavisphingomonas formosensis]|uniref:hypothetical protein n=1 Tax=Flavisphingomonas formosensis TaxID=861534 RepID=UPI0012F80A3F|nr:hypothetical protein [Sphingomonas formosensis]